MLLNFSTMLNVHVHTTFYRTVITFFLFLIRAFVTGVFQAVYVYTPEVYPTSVRAFALGFHTAAARVGAIVTPYMAQVHRHTYTCSRTCIYGLYSVIMYSWKFSPGENFFICEFFSCVTNLISENEFREMFLQYKGS